MQAMKQDILGTGKSDNPPAENSAKPTADTAPSVQDKNPQP